MEIKGLKTVGSYLFSLVFCLLAFGISPSQSLADETAPGRVLAQQATKAKELWITADHSKHEILQQEFKSGPEVTKACLTCHSEAARQFQETIHWTWKDPATAEDQQLGKGGLTVNNF